MNAADPLARPLWRGRTNVDAITVAAIEYAETMAGHEFTITQGSYQSTVSQSAGTHDLGGAVDIAWIGRESDVLALRRAGFAAWHRTPEQGDWDHHIHAVLCGHPLLSPSAAQQISAYYADRNGLANYGADDGPRLNPIPKFQWPPKEIDDMPAYTDWTPEDRAALTDDVAQAVVKRLLATDLTPKADDNDTTVRGALNAAARANRRAQ